MGQTPPSRHLVSGGGLSIVRCVISAIQALLHVWKSNILIGTLPYGEGMAEEMVQACPNCGALDVHVSRENVVDMMGLDHEYTCHNCGFTSKLFPEIPAENVEAFEETFAEEFEDRYLNQDWGFSLSGSNHPRILLGAVLVLFGLTAIPYPGMVSPLTAAAALLVAGVAILAHELQR